MPDATNRQASATAHEDPASDLMKQLHQADGTLTIKDPNDTLRAGYRRAIDAAKRRGLVPEDKQLLHAGRDKGDLIIKLAPAGPDIATDWNRIRLHARDELTGPELFTKLETADKHLDVSEASRPRALELARAAERRGHVFAMSRKTKRLYLRVGLHLFTITIHEQTDQVPRPLPRDDWRLRQA